jgi:hypothetical protein
MESDEIMPPEETVFNVKVKQNGLLQLNLEERSERVSIIFRRFSMSMSRRHFSGTEKVAIRKRHLTDKESGFGRLR